MKTLKELLKIFTKDWNLSNRKEIYQGALNTWEDNQVEFIHEEGNELIIRIAMVNLAISKMRREKDNGIVHYLEVMNEFKNKEKHQYFMSDLADELADYMIIEDQFNEEFMEKVFARLLFKLNRLKKRVDNANKKKK